MQRSEFQNGNGQAAGGGAPEMTGPLAAEQNADPELAKQFAEKVGEADPSLAICGCERQFPLETVEGHGFSRAVKRAIRTGLLAPANRG